MDRANKAALEKYPKRKDGQTRGYVCDDNDVRRIYAQGYRKAEKDLAITKEDVEALIEIWMNLPDFPARSLSQIAEETLDIFNEQRNK